jgi:hypothetical protein
MDSCIISIADVPVLFRTEDHSFAEAIARRYNAFASDATPVARVEVITGEKFSRISGKPPISVAIDADNIDIRYGSSMRCSFDTKESAGTMRTSGDEKAFDIGLRALLTVLLPRHNALLFHGAATVSEGQGFLFFGPSGAGKTTIARLSNDAGKRILADELAAVRCTDGRFLLYGTPFWGEFQGRPEPSGYPLAALVEPVKDGAVRIEDASPADMAVALLKSVFNCRCDPAHNAVMLDRIASLAGSVPGKRMRFDKSPAFWNVLGAA